MYTWFPAYPAIDDVIFLPVPLFFPFIDMTKRLMSHILESLVF